MSGEIVVIKLGSNALLDDTGRLDLVFLDAMAGQIADCARAGRRPVIVSSGAVACGRSLARLDARADALPEKQALAAMGQAQLMHHWQTALDGHGLLAAQILLTADDFHVRERYLNLTASLRCLFELRAIPIINENDVVAVDELTVGDNDRLSAVVAAQLGAERLILLTDIDGVYDADPRFHPAARRLLTLDRIRPALLAAAGGAGTFGRGGMRSKLEAARLAARAGVPTHIAHAREKQVLERLLLGEAIGTVILGQAGGRGDSRRRWLALARQPRGVLTIDSGAAQALQHEGSSLLPVGIRACAGSFKRGDTVAIVDEHGLEIARGLSALAADEYPPILGKRLDAAARILGYALPKAAVHRDNLLLI